MNLTSPRLQPSPSGRPPQDLWTLTVTALVVQAAAVLVNASVYVYDQMSGNWLVAIPIYLLSLPAFVVVGVLGLIQAIRCLGKRKDRVLNSVLLGTSVFMVTGLMPVSLSVQLGSLVVPAARNMSDGTRTREVQALVARPRQRQGAPAESPAESRETKADYDAFSVAFRKPQKIESIEMGYMLLSDGHVARPYGFSDSLKNIRAFQSYGSEHIFAREVMLRLPEYDDFVRSYRREIDAPLGRFGRKVSWYPGLNPTHGVIPVLIVMDGELINSRYADLADLGKYKPGHR